MLWECAPNKLQPKYSDQNFYFYFTAGRRTRRTRGSAKSPVKTPPKATRSTRGRKTQAEQEQVNI